MHLVCRARGMRAAVAHRPAVKRRVMSSVNLAHEPLHLVQGAGQH